jgi:hypothetical protein
MMCYQPRPFKIVNRKVQVLQQIISDVIFPASSCSVIMNIILGKVLLECQFYEPVKQRCKIESCCGSSLRQ